MIRSTNPSVLTLLAFALLSVGALLESAEPDRDEFRSFLGGMKANWDSIRQFDLLRRTDYSRDSVITGGYLETVFERLVFDWDNQRFLYVKRGSLKRIADDAVVAIGNGFVVRDNRVHAFEIPGHDGARLTYLATNEDLHKLFDDHRVPDLYLTPILSYQDPPKRWLDNHRNAYTVFPEIAIKIVKTEETAESADFFVEFASRAAYRWKMDVSHLMPVSREWLLVTKDKGLKSLAKDEFQWKVVNNITVPAVIFGEYSETEYPRGIDITAESLRKHQRTALIRRDMQYEWISVNRPIEAGRFDYDAMNSISKLLALADPVAQGLPLLADPIESFLPSSANDFQENGSK